MRSGKINTTIPRVMILILIICLLIYHEAFTKTIHLNTDDSNKKIKDYIIPALIITTTVMAIEELNVEI